MPTISKIGFCKYKGTLPTNNEGNTIFPIDINEGRGVQFSFDYSWSGDDCTITDIRWRPARIVLNEETNEREVEYGFGLGRTKTEPTAENPVQNYFTIANHLTIQFHNVILDLPNSRNRISSPTGYNFGDLSNPITTTQKYILANFIYSYKPNGEDEESENFVEYFVKIENIKIPKTSKYEHNVIFTENGINELLANIKNYPVIDIESVASDEKEQPNDTQNIWQKYAEGKPCIRINYGNSTKQIGSGNTALVGHKYVAVGSNIKFINPSNNSEIISEASGDQQIGTFRVKIDNKIYQVPIKGLTESGGTFSIIASKANKLVKATDETDYAVGGTDTPIYFSGGIPVACSSNVGGATQPVYMSGGTITSCTYTLEKSVSADAALTDTKNTAGATNTSSKIYLIGATSQDTNPQTYSRSTCYLSAAGYLYADKVYNAVFNDYAEYRTTISLTPGHIVIDQDDGSLACSTTRLQPGAQAISDTFGHSMGETDTAKTPLAVAGRVLVYTYQSRENYHAGMAVCSAPNGTVDIMTREEIRDYPDCIVGIVSEIPQYETWGSGNVKVDGRIWIKVK